MKSLRLGVALIVSALSSVQTHAQDTTSTGRPRSWGAPEWTEQERAQRKEAINAILSFRSELASDSTKIAACTLAKEVQDTSTNSWVDQRYRRLLIAPLLPEQPKGLGCSVYAFSKEGTRVLWLSSLIEVRRRGGVMGAGTPGMPGAGVTFEATFQWLRGPGYRRFELYEVGPGNPEGHWRVVRYELRGEQWIDSFGGARR
jgi:hypothetical protein